MAKRVEHVVIYVEGLSSWVMNGAAATGAPIDGALPAYLENGWHIRRIVPLGPIAATPEERAVGAAYAVLERRVEE
ncbi:MAG: hypothetical protein HUU22_05145 [Phycisphaerae bacterium]|nr:hypothetical protein [Phycisphaerae bacterium]NUQ45399.1 hypothetical protein [Phycisphaerae bacterium]